MDDSKQEEKKTSKDEAAKLNREAQKAQDAYAKKPMKATKALVRRRCTWDCLGRYWRTFCTRMATSPTFSTITTLLTIFALFGDDIRLMSTEKPTDFIFDIVTQVSIAVFLLEVVVRSFGQANYIYGFFFWLDILSTLTLVLDITMVSEMAFGDEISKIEAQEDSSEEGGGGGASAGSSSAEAARAARMSRVGTKASRVVRLIRLIRLIKFVKCFDAEKPQDAPGKSPRAPGQDLDFDDDDEDMDKESAVSKKLSEMTTRRVVILVLVIMLGIPCFQDQTIFFTDTLPFSAHYGINSLYRTWRSGLAMHSPEDGAAQEEAYLQSEERKMYVDDFWMYVYYHNPFSSTKPSSASSSAGDVFSSLFWVGMGPESSPFAPYFFPKLPVRYDLNDRWNGDDWEYYQGDVSSDPGQLLELDWSQAQSCLGGQLYGKSLLVENEPRLNCPEELRYQERSVVFPTSVTPIENENAFWFFIFDRRVGSKMEAMLNTFQTLFICLLLGVGSMTFSNDANKLVLLPIERMIAKIEKIRRNPLAAMQIGEEEHRKEEEMYGRKGARSGTANSGQSETFSETASSFGDAASVGSGSTSTTALFRARKCWQRRRCCRRSIRDLNSVPEPMETAVLEKTIIKIGSLLALGFGEAGAGIIAHNMQGADSSALNAMIPGRRVEAIFGYCNIRNFTDATEVLQDQVMIFVNRIAAVVHSCINEFFGSPNRNIGDAFLLVWDLEDWEEDKQRRLADMSLMSLYKTIAEIAKSPLLAEYRTHLKLQKRLPNFRVRLSFGLHKGWSIEGAIGSEFKIDASYLSPSVEMSAKLESLTKAYGLLIVCSETMIKLLTEDIRDECRLIDHVRFQGYPESVRIYTLDLDDLALPLDKRLNPLYSNKRSGKARKERQKRRLERWRDAFQMYGIFEEDKDMKVMRKKYTNEFLCRYRMAYLNYEAGEWPVAKDMLEETRFLLSSEDGPSSFLLKFMKQYEYKAPKDWPGFRALAP